MNKHNTNHLLTERYALGDKDDYYDALLKIYKPVVTFKEYIDNKYLSDIESKIIELQNQKNEQITFYQKYIKVLANRFDTLINNLNKIKNEYKTFSTNYNKQCEIGLSVIKEIINNTNAINIYCQIILSPQLLLVYYIFYKNKITNLKKSHKIYWV